MTPEGTTRELLVRWVIAHLLSALCAVLLSAPATGAINPWDDSSIAARGIGYGPLNPGPLADDIAVTFWSGSYTARTLDQPTTLYR